MLRLGIIRLGSKLLRKKKEKGEKSRHARRFPAHLEAGVIMHTVIRGKKKRKRGGGAERRDTDLAVMIDRVAATAHTVPSGKKEGGRKELGKFTTSR